MRNLKDSELENELFSQIFANSQVAWGKFQKTSKSIFWTGLSVLPWVASIGIFIWKTKKAIEYYTQILPDANHHLRQNRRVSFGLFITQR